MNLAVVGLQWGDEGKGKVVDLLAGHFHIVARYQGGHNAGHTVYREGQRCVVHHIPAGIFHAGVDVVLGNGMVIDVAQLLKEIRDLEGWGIDWRGRLHISDRAHVITPLHRSAEAWEEEQRGRHSIGTTRRGIGPSYEDKYGRRGLLIGDLVNAAWKEKTEWLWNRFATLYPELAASDPVREDWSRFLAHLRDWSDYLHDHIHQTDVWLRERLHQGDRVLFEGAQGTMLDIDHGTYPFVTSSHCSVGGVTIGLGVGPRWIRKVLGVSKAYATRVGAGPFPTELDDAEGERIRERGQEYGATTGRPRRCGWLDLVALKYACDINEVDGIVLTKLDILDGFPRIKVCISYELDGRETRHCPVRADALARVRPIYQELPGWQGSTYGVTDKEDLPGEALAYIRFIEQYTGRPVVILSSGPQRHETVWLNDPVKVLGFAP